MPPQTDIPLVIANPGAAGGASHRGQAQLARLREAVGGLELAVTQRPGHASHLAREAAASGRRWVIAVGGDGTINEVVNGLIANDRPVNPETALSIVMRGTGNDFRRSLTGSRSADEDIRALARGTRRQIDVGKVTFTGHDGKPAVRYFDNLASFGLSGEVDRRVNAARAVKTLGGKATFAWATLGAIFGFENPQVTLTFDDGERSSGKFRLGVVANGRFAGGGMCFAPGARLDDGRFDVVLLGDFGLAATLRNFPKIYRGTHIGRPGVTHRQAVRLVAESPQTVLLDIDGEAPGRLPATFEIVPHVLTVLA